MIFYQNKQGGFSLVETLVAISILMIVIVGPMSISMRTAKSSSFATEQIQAFFLAQEGVELMHKHVDDYYLSYFNGITANPWGDATNQNGSYGSCYTAGVGCGLQWDSANANTLKTPISCSSGACLLYRTTTGRSKFTHVATGNQPTVFTRKIILSDYVPNKQVRVQSIVTWRTGSIVADQKVEVDTYIYNVYGTN